MKLLNACLLVSTVTAASLDTRQSGKTATVDIGITQGQAQQLASGVLYGTPDTLNQIPDEFYTGPKLKYFRAGGAQLFGTGKRGWHYNEYPARFQSTLNNYKTARKYGGEFQILPHDIWGTDTANSSTRWPGDNGDWSNYEAFIKRLIQDIKNNNMVPGLKMDIWNEPDFNIFWKRSKEQYLEMWKRTYQLFRNDGGVRSVPIIGPSFSAPPSPNNAWWTSFMPYVVAQNVVPDQYTWHILGGGAGYDLQNNVITMNNFYNQYGAPRRSYSINEYINSGEDRMNAATAWHIARLERYNATGLRANWLGGSGLHDFLAELVYRPNAQSQYQPNGAWQMYKYYAQSMAGTKLATTGTGDLALDVFATRGGDGKVRILTGVRAKTGTWEIEVRNLAALGLPTSGTVKIQTYGFDDTGPKGVSSGPSNRGLNTHTYSGNVLKFPIYQTTADAKTAWAFELSRP